MYSKIATLGSLLIASAVAAKDPFYRAICKMDPVKGSVTGKITMKQNGTIDDEGEPVRIMGVRLGNVPDEAALEFYVKDPTDPVHEGFEPFDSLGEWFASNRGKISVGGMRRADLCLKNEAPDVRLHGRYIGVRDLETEEIVGCCKISVTQVGNHPDESDDDDGDDTFIMNNGQ